jgi:hypothetical protein
VYFDDRSTGNASYVFSGDMNGDGAINNDLVYIPRTTGEMNFLPITGATPYTAAQEAAAWDAFISQDPYLSKHRGQYAERNAVFLPKVFRADLSVSQDVGREIAGKPNRLQIRLDFLNFTNRLNHHWGVSQAFVTTRPLISAGVDANGAAQYRLATVGGQLISRSFTPAVTTADVWRLQLGVRYLMNW